MRIIFINDPSFGSFVGLIEWAFIYLFKILGDVF